MVRLKCGGLLVLALSVTAAGCGTNAATTPVNPTPVTIVEVFSGTLTVNGGVSQPFIATSAGTVQLTVTALADSNGPTASGPDGAIRIGLQLGTWNGTGCYISTLYNETAYVSTAVTGRVTAAGTLCARVYDSGKLSEPVDFEVQISHP
jgi:hypothetical protein